MKLDWKHVCVKIIDSFDLLKQLLREKAFCSENRICIPDPPYLIEILKKEELIVLRKNEDIAIVGREGLKSFCANEDDIRVLEEWCLALSTLSFRRYIARK